MSPFKYTSILSLFLFAFHNTDIFGFLFLFRFSDRLCVIAALESPYEDAFTVHPISNEKRKLPLDLLVYTLSLW